MLKKHIKPFLIEPKYEKLKDPSKINAIKTGEMMKDLASSVNELVEDQIHMRTCIQLTGELKKFYNDLMGKQIYADDDGQDYEDFEVDDDIEEFLAPKKRFARNIEVSVSMESNLSLTRNSIIDWQ
jgi:hypothetical protein